MELDGMIVLLPELPDLVVGVGVGVTACCVPLTGDVDAEGWLAAPSAAALVAGVWLCDPFAAALVALAPSLLVAAAAPASLAVAVAVAGAKVPVEPSALE